MFDFSQQKSGPEVHTQNSMSLLVLSNGLILANAWMFEAQRKGLWLD